MKNSRKKVVKYQRNLKDAGAVSWSAVKYSTWSPYTKICTTESTEVLSTKYNFTKYSLSSLGSGLARNEVLVC